MHLRRLRAALLTVAGFALIGGQLQAVPITGTMNITGSVIVISDDFIDWVPDGTGTGIVSTVDPGTGYFTGIFNPAVSPAYTASIRDLPGANPFLFSFTAPGYAGLTYNLSSILAPSDPDSCLAGDPGVGESCTFGVFLLTNAGNNNTTITLKIDGTFQDPVVGPVAGRPGTGPYDPTYYIGTFSTQLAGRSIPNIVQDITAGGPGGCSDDVPAAECDGVIRSSFSANFASPIPEPGTVAMMLGGLALVIGARLRRRV